MAVLLTAPAIAQNKVVERGLQSTVQIQADTVSHYDMAVTGDLPPDEMMFDKSMCSGFIGFSKGTYNVIVTARHCAEPTPIEYMGLKIGETTVTPSSVLFSDGDKAKVESIWKSPDADLAVLVVHSKHPHPYVLLHEGFERAQKLFVLGMPWGESWSYSEATSMQGAVYATNRPAPWEQTYLLDCPSCGAGVSGGPAFNYKGEVVGDLVAGNMVSHFLIVPAKKITNALKSFTASRKAT